MQDQLQMPLYYRLRYCVPALVGVGVAAACSALLESHAASGESTQLLWWLDLPIGEPFRTVLASVVESTRALLMPLQSFEQDLPVLVVASVASIVATLFIVVLCNVAACCCHSRAANDVVEHVYETADPEVTLTIAMLSAIESDNPGAVAAAVERGAPIDGPLRGACGITAPQLAALLGKAAALRRLQELGADLIGCHPTRMLGGNCIHGAALGSHTSTTEYLIRESGLFSNDDNALVDLDVPLRNGMTALFLACQAGNLGVVERLASANADPTITRRDGSTCLFISAKNGHHRVVQYLLDCTKAGDIIEAKVTKGMQYSGATALWVCCEKGRGQSLQMLLRAGAAANVGNVAGATALMVAADCGQLDAVQQLLVDGRLSLSEICARDCNGCDALSFALDQGHDQIARLLQDHITSSKVSDGPENGTLTRSVSAISKQVGKAFQGHPPTGLLRFSWRCGVSTDLQTGRAPVETDDNVQFELKCADYPELFELLEPVQEGSSLDNAAERTSVVRAVEESCSQMHGTFLQVFQVYRVRCCQTVSDQYKQTVAQLHEPTKLHLTNLFHGTTEAAMLSICQHGFDPNHVSFRGGGMAGPKMFGNGLYLATNAVRSVAVRAGLCHNLYDPFMMKDFFRVLRCGIAQTKSAQMRYTKGSNKLLLCEAALGNTWSVTQSMPFLTPLIVHAKGYDSVTALGGEGKATKNDEYVLYQAQAKPTYVVEFIRRRAPPNGWP